MIFSYSIDIIGDTISTTKYQTENGVLKTILTLKNVKITDTSWSKEDNILKSVSSSFDNKQKKTEYKYNEKGDEIESISFDLIEN